MDNSFQEWEEHRSTGHDLRRLKEGQEHGLCTKNQKFLQLVIKRRYSGMHSCSTLTSGSELALGTVLNLTARTEWDTGLSRENRPFSHLSSDGVQQTYA